MAKSAVCVVGLGYIGLPTAALLATGGYDVIGVDLNEHAVDTINLGRIHIVEPSLDAYVHSAVMAGKLKAYTRPRRADIYMICVPTPFHEGGDIPQPNIDYVLAAADSIGDLLKPGDLVILESTSPVGTTQKMADELRMKGIDTTDIHFAYCPERVLPGNIMHELVENDRIVGGLTPAATKQVSAFYRSFVKGTVLETDAATAEMCKLTENSFRDVNIAFANELSLLCDRAGIDVWNLIEFANHHPRVNILKPGAGVGGHCIAIDPWFIVAADPKNARLIHQARLVNNNKTEWVIAKIKAAADAARLKTGRRPKIACLGLAFKPDIDDLRESPAIRVAATLSTEDYDIVAVEPNVSEGTKFELVTLEEAEAIADVIAVLVKHRPFVEAAKAGALSGPHVLDFCGIRR